MMVTAKSGFYTGGNVIDAVNQWSHLGHITDDRSNHGLVFHSDEMQWQVKLMTFCAT